MTPHAIFAAGYVFGLLTLLAIGALLFALTRDVALLDLTARIRKTKHRQPSPRGSSPATPQLAAALQECIQESDGITIWMPARLAQEIFTHINQK